MALTLVDTPAATNANAYVDSAAVSAFADFRIGSAFWALLNPDQMVQAIVTAAYAIDSLEEMPGFIDERYSDTQSMAWPRGSDVTLPVALTKANIELAIFYARSIAAGSDVLNADSNGNIKVDQVGPIRTEYFERRSPSIEALTAHSAASVLDQFPDSVRGYLYSLVKLPTIGGWGSAEVTRGS